MVSGVKSGQAALQTRPYHVQFGDFADFQALRFATVNARDNVLARRFQRLQRLYQRRQHLCREKTPGTQMQLDKGIDGPNPKKYFGQQQHFVLNGP